MAGATALVVIVVIALAAGGVFSSSSTRRHVGSRPTGPSRPTAPSTVAPTTSPATTSSPSTTTPSTTSPGTTPHVPGPSIAQLMPTSANGGAAQNQVATNCNPVTTAPTAGWTGTWAGLGCMLGGDYSGLTVNGFKFATSTAFTGDLLTTNNAVSFYPSQAGSTCPPVANKANSGYTPWYHTEGGKKSGGNQGELECITLHADSESADVDSYIITYPGQNTFFIVYGTKSTPWSEIDGWFKASYIPGYQSS